MSLILRFSSELVKKLRKINYKDKNLSTLIEKQLDLFGTDPKHHSLRTHKLSGKLQNIFSISINKKIRMTFILQNNEAYFINIGSHDEIYGKEHKI